MHANIRSKGLLAAGIIFITLAGFGCGDDDPASPPGRTCDNAVDMFPVPVDGTTSLFPDVDDSFLEVLFPEGFTFTFYGTAYTSVFLNTNGGLTFGAGDSDYDLAAADVDSPGIAVFWGDMDAGEYAGETRAQQFVYRQCSDRFEVTYTALQDNDEETSNNTATLTLYPNGNIKIVYGDVMSEDLLVGVFDGTHESDQYLDVQSTYTSYPAAGSGIILFDAAGVGPVHARELDGVTIEFKVQ